MYELEQPSFYVVQLYFSVDDYFTINLPVLEWDNFKQAWDCGDNWRINTQESRVIKGRKINYNKGYDIVRLSTCIRFKVLA